LTYSCSIFFSTSLSSWCRRIAAENAFAGPAGGPVDDDDDDVGDSGETAEGAPDDGKLAGDVAAWAWAW
jgi:hypothetical protein